MRFIAVLLMSVLLGGCQGDPAVAGAKGSGRTPEWTVRRYQSLVDQNAFEEAKKMSTPAERERLDQLEAIMVGESLDDAVLTSDFLSINCREEGDTAYCRCVVEDPYERYELVYKLVYSKGQWLVDAPEDDGNEEELMEEVLGGMRDIMQ